MTDSPLHISQLKLPAFKEAEPLLPKVREAGPNPYDDIIKELADAVDVKGYSKSREFQVEAQHAKVHVNAIRRAAKKLNVGISVPHDDPSKVEPKAKVTISFGVVPKRTKNAATDKVETPA